MKPSPTSDSTAQPSAKHCARIGYVLKRYPRFSETFVVNEILAHEQDGLAIEIFALRPPVDTHFQDSISRVKAPVNYLPSNTVKSSLFWEKCHALAESVPDLWHRLAEAKFATAVDAYQAMLLAEQIRKKKISHLHAHFATSAATVARLAAMMTGIDYSVTMHAKDIFHESVVEEDLKSKIDDAKFVVTVSDFNKQYLTERFGVNDKIFRVYNGLDLERFPFHPERPPRNKIIAVGRLVPKKGLGDLIDACRILADQDISFECEIIGTGELGRTLKRKISDQSLEKYVHLAGPQPQDMVRKKVADATVFAAPCVVAPDGNRDGLPTVITESLALGTPCVSTDVTGIPEIIRHQETGILVPQRNATQLAEQIGRLFSDPQLCQTLARNGRQLIESEFDIRRNVAQIREHLIGVEPSSSGRSSTQLQKII